MNWLHANLEDDSFGQALLNAGIDRDTIKAWSLDPRVTWSGQSAGLFDAFEDMDSEPLLAKAVEIYRG